VHHVGILYGQFMMHGQRNIKIFLITKKPNWESNGFRETCN